MKQFNQPLPTICFLLCTGMLIVASAAQEGVELGGFRLPDYDANGVKKSELIGKSAILKQGGKVDIQDFKIDFYEADGETVKMTVTAPQCTYVRHGRIAKSPSSVRIEGGNMVVTGKDFAWDGKRELFKIFSNSKVVFKGTRSDLLKLPDEETALQSQGATP